MEERFKVAVESAKRAGKILREGFGRFHHVEFKGEIDLVTEVDRESENLIKSIIRHNFPGDGIMAEEGAYETESTRFLWYVDPLDGTTNYAHGFPVFCVSIAVAESGVMRCGVVYDPLRDELFTAKRGSGAFLGKGGISVSNTEKLSEGLLATGFPYDIRVSSNDNLNYFSAFAVKAQGIRRPGSAAIDLCYLAAGRIDGFWEIKLNPWDTAAGALIVEEAGGRVSDFHGGPYRVDMKEILASNGLIHNEMIQVLESV